MSCQVCLREPAYEVIAYQIPPHRYRLCEGCCRLWAARGIAVATVEAEPDAEGARALVSGGTSDSASTAAVALNRAPSESALSQS